MTLRASRYRAFSRRWAFCPKADLSGLLLASMEEVVRIAAGEVPPSRVHTAEAIAAAAGPQGVQEAARQARVFRAGQVPAPRPAASGGPPGAVSARPMLAPAAGRAWGLRRDLPGTSRQFP